MDLYWMIATIPVGKQDDAQSQIPDGGWTNEIYNSNTDALYGYLCSWRTTSLARLQGAESKILALGGKTFWHADRYPPGATVFTDVWGGTGSSVNILHTPNIYQKSE